MYITEHGFVLYNQVHFEKTFLVIFVQHVGIPFSLSKYACTIKKSIEMSLNILSQGMIGLLSENAQPST